MRNTMDGMQWSDSERTGGQQFIEGVPVFDRDGDKVGTVSEHGVQQGSLVVHHGLLRQDVYVPLNGIQRHDANGVYVSLTREQVGQLGPGANVGNVGNVAPGTRRSLESDQNEVTMRSPGMGGTPDTPLAAGQGMGMMDTGAATGAGNARPGQGDVAIPVREEQLRVERERDAAGAGRAHVHKDVVEQQQTISAPVTHEELRVEHRPVRGDVPPDAQPFQEQDIDIPLMGEQLNVEKHAHVVDELHLRKESVTEQQQASGTVRKERINIEGVDQPRNNVNGTDAVNGPNRSQS